MIKLKNQIEKEALLLRHVAPNIIDLMRIFFKEFNFSSYGIKIGQHVHNDLLSSKELILKAMRNQAEKSEAEQPPAYAKEISNDTELKKDFSALYIAFGSFFDFIRADELKTTGSLNQKIRNILDIIPKYSTEEISKKEYLLKIQTALNGAKT